MAGFFAALVILITPITPAAFAPAIASAVPERSILAGVAGDFPPFSIKGEDNLATGFSVELLRAVLKKMGKDITFRTGSWEELRIRLQRGEIDVLPMVGRTPERERFFDFTVPYMTLHGAIIVRKGTTDIRTLDDLSGKQVALMKGGHVEEFLRGRGNTIEIRPRATFVDAMRELSQGMHDAVVLQHIVALRLIQQDGLSNLEVAASPIEGFKQEMCIGVREGNRDLLASLNEGLALVTADGTYRRLQAKWFATFQLPANRRIVIGGDRDFPPFEYLDPYGRPAGFNVDLTRAIAVETGLDIEIRLDRWSEILKGIESGEIDAVQGMFHSTGRELKFDFTQPYVASQHVAVVRKANYPAPTSFDALAGKRVAVQRGDIMHDFAMENLLGGQIRAFETQEEALGAVVSGKQDCALVSKLTALYLIRKNNWSNLLVGQKSFLSPEYGYAALPDRKALLAQLGEGLKVLSETGQYRRIYDKWMGIYETPDSRIRHLLMLIAIAAIPVTMALGAASLWLRMLRRQVAIRTAELQKSEGFLKAMIACSPVALFSVDTNGHVHSWNDSAERILGWTANEVIGKPLPTIPRSRQAEYDSHRQQALKGESFSSREVVRIKKDGTLFTGSLSVGPIRSADGNIVGVMAALEDITDRKQIEKQVRESEKRFRRAVEEAPFPMMIHAEDGQVLVLSRAWEEISGYSRIELSTTAEWTSRAYGDRSPIVNDIIQKTYAYQERRRGGIFEVTCRDGAGRMWDFSTTPLGSLPDGRRVVITMAADVTEHILAREVIRSRETMLNKMMDVLPIGLWVVDAEGSLIRGNEAAQRIWGGDIPTSDDELARIKIRRLPSGDPVPPEDWALARTIRDGRAILNEPLEIDALDGVKRTILNSSSPVFDEQGKINAAVNVNVDVTEQIRIEAERERLAAAIEQAGEMVLITDADGSIQYVNAAFENVTGYSRRETIGSHASDLNKNAQDDHFHNSLKRVLAGGTSFTGRLTARRKNGSFYTEEATISPIRNASGQITSIVAVKRDITNELRLAAQLQQAQKMESIGRLAGGVAHDYNNTLSVIYGFANLALQNMNPEDPLYDDLLEIIGAARRSRDITRQLLAFARKETIAPQVLDLNKVVEDLLKMLRRLIGEDIQLDWKPKPDLWPVKMDPSQIDQILANLCVNARDAIIDVGRITIETGTVTLDDEFCSENPGSVPGDHVLLSVSDDGCGMDPETLGNIFEPFFTTKEEGRGTGLGLATVYGIVKQNEGYIGVWSEPGKGSRFRIYLRRYFGKEAEAQKTGFEEVCRGRGETVLVVEDDPGILRLTVRILENAGYKVLQAKSPAEALELPLSRMKEIDLLISDVIMPGMNGKDFATKLQAVNPKVTTIFMSGYTADVIAPKGILDSGINYIQKPFSAQDLAAKVRWALEPASAREAKRR